MGIVIDLGKARRDRQPFSVYEARKHPDETLAALMPINSKTFDALNISGGLKRITLVEVAGGEVSLIATLSRFEGGYIGYEMEVDSATGYASRRVVPSPAGGWTVLSRVNIV